MKKISPKQYALALFSATIEASEKHISQIMENFVKLVVANHDRKKIPDIIHSLDALYVASGRSFQVSVTTVSQISKNDVESLKNVLKKNFGGDIDIMTNQDESILGGAVVRINDTIYDGSVRSTLSTLYNKLIS